MKSSVLSFEEALSYLAKKSNGIDHVFLLHDDVADLELLQRQTEIPVDSCGGLFHQVFAERSDEILDVYRALRRVNPSERYWKLMIASRNGASDRTAKNLCFLACALELRKKYGGHLAFVVKSPALGFSLSEVLDQKSHVGWQFRLWARRFVDVAKVAFRATRFLGSSLRSWFASRSIAPGYDLSSLSRLVLIRSWVTTGSLTASVEEPGSFTYRDRNFGVLGSFLRSRGYTPIYLPMFFNLDISDIEFMRRASRASEPIIIAEHYLKIRDLLSACVLGLAAVTIRTRSLHFVGVDVAAILAEGNLQTACSPEVLRLGLSSALLKRLSVRNIQFEEILYPFENNATEKSMLLAARRYYSGVPIVGFQHSPWYREQLSMVITSDERADHLLPDTILCCGRRYISVLNSKGFPLGRLGLGANLRFPEIQQPVPDIPFDVSSRVPVILAVLNFSESQSIEVLAHLHRARAQLRGQIDFEVQVKAHPLLNRSHLESFLHKLGEESFKFVEGSVRDLALRSAAVVMAGASVSSFETLALRVPLVRISLSADFDLDCFWDSHEFSRFESTTAELRERLSELILHPERFQTALTEVAKLIQTRYFEPVNDVSLNPFLPSFRSRDGDEYALDQILSEN
jgi:hypothetical protein